MLFHSVDFFILFFLVVSLYYAFPYQHRWVILLTASCVFYMAFIPVYILALFLLILVDYTAAIFIARSEGRRRKIFLLVSIVSTCAVLFIFKYFNFFNTNLLVLAKWLHWNYPINTLALALPVGLSFHTFQSLNYVIDVYRGTQKPERHFGIYALFVMFFPQLVAGPIERARNLLPQFFEKHDFDYQRVADGLKLMAWGLFKKVVVADRLAMLVNNVYGEPFKFQGISLIVATVAFAFQIYYDFSAYSDIAIGSAKVLGFRLMRNFNRPYAACSFSEFWQRWHISLSTWFRDYLYIPLGGSRVSLCRWVLNVYIVFLVSGLWHGANWTYVIWGGIHGTLLIVERFMSGFWQRVSAFFGISGHSRIAGVVQRLVVFSLVCIAWVFFRADSLTSAFYIITHLFSGVGAFFYGIAVNFKALGSGQQILYPLFPFQENPKENFIILVICLAFVEVVHFLQEHKDLIRLISGKPFVLRFSVYAAFILIMTYFGRVSVEPFIYFQF